MEKQYSVQFFTSFVENLQELCRNYLSYSQFVEVSGYVCVEIDNIKKERYVLSELLHSHGNVVSESYCTKVFKTTANLRTSNPQSNSRMQQQSTSVGEHVDRRKENRNFQSRSSIMPTILHTSSSSGSKRKSSDTSEFEEFGHDRTLTSAPKRSAIVSNLETQKYLPSGTINTSQSSSSEFSSCPTRRPKEHMICERSVTVPQTLSKDSPRISHSEHSPVSGSPSSSRQNSVASDLPPEEEVIDLDMFEDNLDIPGDGEEDGSAGGAGATFAQSSASFENTQQRKAQLSPGSLVAVNNAVKRFRRFISFKYGKDIDLLTTSPEELNEMILVFFKESRKKDGGELAGVTMKNIQSYLELFLRDNGYPYSVSKGHQFQTARDYIKNKMEEVVKTMSQVMSPVNDDDIETLFQTNQLGGHTPDSLSNTMWFLNTKFLTIRRPAEHFNLKWGDIVLKMDEQGNEYIERPINESFSLKLFSNPDNPNRCFVNFYKQFRAQRPKLWLEADSPFYLKTNRFPGDDYWFTPEPMSWSMLSSLWRKMVLNARLPLNKRIA